MREPACLQIPLLAVKTGQPRTRMQAFGIWFESGLKRLHIKKALLLRASLFVWRSGRDSNSRPHAWQACILTKLNYRTVLLCVVKELSFFLKSECKSTNFFPFSKEKNSFFWKYFFNMLIFNINNIHFYFTKYHQKSCKTPCFVPKNSFLRVIVAIVKHYRSSGVCPK